MTDKKENVVPFEKRILDLKNFCNNSFKELIRLGYEKEKARHNCRISKKGNSVHVSFSPEFLQIIRDVSKHGDIKKILSLNEKNSFQKTKLIITRKEVVAQGEVGPSLLIYLIQRACDVKKKKLLGEERNKLRRLKKDIKASFAATGMLKASVKVKTRSNAKGTTYNVYINVKKNKEECKFTFPEKLIFSSYSPEKIISEINEYIRACVLAYTSDFYLSPKL